MSGSSENIIKEVSAVWSRLFDHRPFLQGEINFFLKEFEEKRGEREVEKLFEILEKSTEIKDSQIDKVKHSSATTLPELHDILNQSNQLSDQVLNARITYDPEASLKEKCKSLEASNKQFDEDLVGKYKAVDETFAEKEKLVREYYQQLSEKLNQSVHL
uniref:Biogenesis of lysosome-related organelles complex 1 subunit 5 n=1 Tax=Cacopsylla melanoneura TaxID=428564 RepID=A0A8D8QMX3_9HEMI